MKRFIKWTAVAVYAEFIFHVVIYTVYKMLGIYADPIAFVRARAIMMEDATLGTAQMLLIALLCTGYSILSRSYRASTYSPSVPYTS